LGFFDISRPLRRFIKRPLGAFKPEGFKYELMNSKYESEYGITFMTYFSLQQGFKKVDCAKEFLEWLKRPTGVLGHPPQGDDLKRQYPIYLKNKEKWKAIQDKTTIKNMSETIFYIFQKLEEAKNIKARRL